MSRSDDVDLAPFFELPLTLVCVLGLDGYFRRVSAAWIPKLGWSLDELLSTRYIDFVHPDYRAHTLAGVIRVASGEEIAPFENRCRCKDGSWKWLLWAGRIAPGTDLIYASAIDITERRIGQHELELRERALAQQAEELTRARDAALAAVRAKDAFLATMSHELRTPLNGVIGMTSLLLDSSLTPDQDYTETIRSSGEALLALVNDVLDVSKIGADRLALETVEFALPTVVREAVDAVTAQLRLKGLTLETVVDPALSVRVAGDPHRLRQVLINLLANAVKFTERGGINLRVRREPEAVSPISVRFEVRDTGIGIAAAAVPRLFERFSQVDDSSTRRHGGAGLGLAISRHLVELMGGRIGVTSTPGEGSLFWFTVRMAHIGPIDRTPSVHAGGLHRFRGRVLVVEDNEVNQRVAARMLARLGLSVDIADSGNDAVRAAGLTHYDLMFMDCQMPEMDGFEATRRIRFDEGAARHTPIVAMTANALDGDRERCLAVGMDDYLSKPVSLAALERILDRWLDHGRW